MRLLELFAGSRSVGTVAEAMGYEVFSTDLKPFERIDLAKDVLTIEPSDFPFIPDFIWASPPCFTGDQLVLTMRGHLPIKDVRKGDLVLTHECRWRRVTAAGRKKVNTVKVLKGWGTDHVKATSNHPFLTRTKRRAGHCGVSVLSDRSWTEAKDLVGKQWAVPLSATKSTYSLVLEPYLIGRWLGDGWANVDRGEVMMCAGHHESDDLRSRLDQSWKPSKMPTSTRFTLADSGLAWWLAKNVVDLREAVA
jgi:hypothetical protein